MNKSSPLSYLFLLCLVLSSLLSGSLIHAEEDFLRPEKAFQLIDTQVETDPDGKSFIQAKWKVADGYYMYKNKVSFSTDNEDIKLGKPILPAGKVKNDEFFGKIEVYKKKLQVKIPVTSQITGKEISITAKTQGCAEAGICYPPLRQTINFTLPENTASSKQNLIPNPASILASIADNTAAPSSSNTDSEEEEFADPEKAFKLNVTTNTQGQVIATWDIMDGYYLYKDKFRFETVPVDSQQIGIINFPKAKQKSDEFLGDYEVYDKQVAIQIPLKSPASKNKTIDVKIQYQGCAAAGICYPLQKKTISINTQTVKFDTATDSTQAVSKNKPGKVKAVQLSEQDALADYLSKGNNILILITFFGLGLALAFTPCVFPMIPILSGIIAGQGEKVDARKAFMISVVYVLAMAVTYTIAGVFAGMSGENIQIWFQNPWVLSSFALIFILLALSMFGFYELQLPSSLQSKITELSNKQKGGNYTGVVIMGFLSALIVGPCVAPPLMGALIYISQTGDPFLGGGALFSMSLGMGLPLILIGTSAGKFLPRAGVWMDAVKAGFGVMMLGIAIWMLERVLPGVIILWLWAVLFIFSAVYIGALTPIHDNTTGWARFRKALGLVMLIYGAILIIAASAGSTDLMQPLKGLASGNGSVTNKTTQHLQFKKITSIEQLNQELDKAKQSGKNVMVDYYADWCISCVELEKYTFTDAKVIESLSGFTLLQADVTKDNEDSKQLLKTYQLIGPPAILFFNQQGQELRHFRLVGYKEAAPFTEHVNKFKAN
jgi:thioredoxin:protein disulfide reductase